MVLDWGCVLFRIRLAASIFCFLFFLHPPTHSFARTEKKLEGPHYGLRRTGESQAPARFRRARTRMELGQATDPADPERLFRRVTTMNDSGEGMEYGWK
jgi:hypothetical protein